MRALIPSLRKTDFVDDLRLTLGAGGREELNKAIALLLVKGEMFFHKEGPKLIWATQRIPFLGFVVNSSAFSISVEEDRQKGLSLCYAMHEAHSTGPIIAKELLRILGLLNYLCVIVPGGSTFLRPGWEALLAAGVYDPGPSLPVDATREARWGLRAKKPSLGGSGP